MELLTVDFGIDLGTTNSAIARAKHKGASIIKNHLQSDTTPSAVARNSAGQTLVGQDALDKIALCPAQNFKRLMGSEQKVRLLDGSEWSPEELSSEVLKSLKTDVMDRYGLEPEYVVVTVPAMFQQPQCEATHRAAGLAGLTAVSLLQEPIAAATAYLNDEPRNGNFLVYDLGGGTFDVSVVRVRDNEMSVLTHGGDNFLGGSDFDQALFEWAVEHIERISGPRPELRQSPTRNLLLKACESAKKWLTRSAETHIDLCDLPGELPPLPITRSLLEILVADQVTRTLRLAKERLDSVSLKPQDIDSIFLVGGPTQMPFVRRRLKEEFGIRLSLDLDPMTVVAVGAAISASSLLIPNRNRTTSASGNSALLDLHYDPVSPDLRTSLAGRIIQPVGFVGEIRLSRKAGDWETGWISLNDGAFFCELVLETGATTEFAINLRDQFGNSWSVDIQAIAIRHGLPPANSVTPYDYGVALADGSFEVIVSRNTPLPADGANHQLHTAKKIVAGSDDELSIFFLEGASPVAADNVQVGELRIKGSDLRHTLQAGEKVEIRISVNESRFISACVSIPVLDLDYEVPDDNHPDGFVSLTKSVPITDLQRSVRGGEYLSSQIAAVVNEDDEIKLSTIQYDMAHLNDLLEMVKNTGTNDSDAAQSANSKLASLKADLRVLEKKYALAIAYEAACSRIKRAEEIASRFNDEKDRKSLLEFEINADLQQKLGSIKGLKDIDEKAGKIYSKHYWKTHEAWVSYVEYVRNKRTLANDLQQFNEWLKRAEDCLRDKDYDGLEVNARQALKLVPASDSEGVGFDAGLER